MSKVRVTRGRPGAGIKGAARRPAEECPDWTVEKVQGFHTELQFLALGNGKTLVQAEVYVGVARTAEVADAARSESVGRRNGNVGWIEVLDVGRSIGCCVGRNVLIQDLDRAVAIREAGQSLRLDTVGVGSVAANAPTAEIVERQSVSGVESDDPTDFPISDNGVKHRIHVLTELFAATNRQLIGHIAGEDVRLIEVARAPISPGVIDVLPAGLAA